MVEGKLRRWLIVERINLTVQVWFIARQTIPRRLRHPCISVSLLDRGFVANLPACSFSASTIRVINPNYGPEVSLLFSSFAIRCPGTATFPWSIRAILSSLPAIMAIYASFRISVVEKWNFPTNRERYFRVGSWNKRAAISISQTRM